MAYEGRILVTWKKADELIELATRGRLLRMLDRLLAANMRRRKAPRAVRLCWINLLNMTYELRREVPFSEN